MTGVVAAVAVAAVVNVVVASAVVAGFDTFCLLASTPSPKHNVSMGMRVRGVRA